MFPLRCRQPTSTPRASTAPRNGPRTVDSSVCTPQKSLMSTNLCNSGKALRRRHSRSSATLSRRILLSRSSRISLPLCRGLVGKRLLRGPPAVGMSFLRTRGPGLVTALLSRLSHDHRRRRRGHRAHRYSDGGIHPHSHRCLRARNSAHFRVFSSNCVALRTLLSARWPKRNFRTVVCVASRKTGFYVPGRTTVCASVAGRMRARALPGARLGCISLYRRFRVANTELAQGFGHDEVEH